MAETTKPKKPSIWKRIGKFFKDYKSEFNKLVWPTPKQLLKNSSVVLVTIVFAEFLCCYVNVFSFLIIVFQLVVF